MTNPQKILDHKECFDVAYASSGGAYGAGLYFAKQSNYSLRNYAFYTPEGTKWLFYA
jgi:hypothetical protein